MAEKDASNRNWKTKLDPETYRITREKGTEAAFTGKYWNEHAKGMYQCSNCGVELFSSEAKFDSSTGWPSFTEPTNKENVTLKKDKSPGMDRVEVLCKKCGAHLGHVFPDGPGPTCERFCINSASLNLKKDTI